MNIESCKWQIEDAQQLAEALNNKKIPNNLQDGLSFPCINQRIKRVIRF